MGWFDEQIRQRSESDQNILEDSFFRMASVVMDKWDADRLEDERLIAKEAIDEILKYFPPETGGNSGEHHGCHRAAGIRAAPLRADDPGRGAGGRLAERRLRADAGLHEGDRRHGGAAAREALRILLPGSGHREKDPGQRKNAKLFSREALCFYQPLPMKKLGFRICCSI